MSELGVEGLEFVPDGGVTGALIRSLDWSRHPLGHPRDWSATLRSVLGVIFGSRHPMFLFWGPEHYCFYNDAYMPSFGRGKHPAAMGQRGVECWAEIWPVIYPQIEAALSRGEASWNEDQLIPIYRNGQLEDVYWTYSYSPVYDGGGDTAGVMVVCTETTRQVIATAELRASESRLLDSEQQLQRARAELESFLVQAPIGIAILSGPDHVYRFVNPAFMTLLFGGAPGSHLLGKAVRRALPELEGQGFFEILDAVYRTGQPFVGSKLRISLVQPDGTNRDMFVNFKYQAKHGEGGRIDGILAVVYEVTDSVNEQREIELLAENLRAALTARDAFLGIASHELNTPVTTLGLQNESAKRHLARNGASGFPAERLLKLFSSNALQLRRLASLINDMLDISRISAGRLTMEMAPGNVSQLVSEVLERFATQLSDAGCEVVAEIEPDVVCVCDAARIDQVVSNLLTNAIKYAPGARVTVAVGSVGSGSRVSVADSGRGIAREDQQRIFGRFERATSSATDPTGFGLGLYICKRIIDEHRGSLDVESEVGRGSRFVFVIPGMEVERTNPIGPPARSSK